MDYKEIVKQRHRLTSSISIVCGTIGFLAEERNRDEKTRGGKALNENTIFDFVINRIGMLAYLRRKAIIRGFYTD